MNKFNYLLAVTSLCTMSLNAQVSTVDSLETEYLNWYEQDALEGDKMGCSVTRAYDELLKDKEVKKTVIVAVLDSGIDIYHEDLEGKIWTNEDEIADNGIDDDGNGYIDDVNGWNFLGRADGTNVVADNLELTRIIRDMGVRHPQYEQALEQHTKDLAEQKEEMAGLKKFNEIYRLCQQNLKEETGVMVRSLDDLKGVIPTTKVGANSKAFLRERYTMGLTEESLDNMIERNKSQVEYYLNRRYDPRAIIGDDPQDMSDRGHGNPDVNGGNADHGTCVAGVIAAVRGNDIGINGIAENVLIMPVRTTPDGDERDKDVALGIMYAADNGADIINMSFGKSYSANPEFVEAAIEYAKERGVLMIHSAGNSGVNIDKEASYPRGRLTDGTEASNWICIGASSFDQSKEAVAIFSNYGSSEVDFFAPGTNIITTDSSSTYNMVDGTSFSSPVVSGVAALILSYYPDFTPEEVIDILMVSSHQFKKPKKVYLPGRTAGKRKKVKFTELSKQGGVVNAYSALKEAEARAAAQ